MSDDELEQVIGKTRKFRSCAVRETRQALERELRANTQSHRRQSTSRIPAHASSRSLSPAVRARLSRPTSASRGHRPNR